MILLATLWARIKGYALVSLVAIGAILGAYTLGARDGRRDEASKGLRTSLNTIKDYHDRQAEVSSVSDADLDRRVRKYVR